MQFIYREEIMKINPMFSFFLFLSILMIAVAACAILMYMYETWDIITVFVIWLLMAMSITCLSVVPKDVPTGKCRYEVIPLRDDWEDLIEGNYVVVEERGVVKVLEDLHER